MPSKPNRMKMFTARLEDEHLEFLDRAGPRRRSWRLRRDLEILQALIEISKRIPDMRIDKAFDMAMKKKP